MFAATAQGPFVSRDDGDSWQQLTRNGATKLIVSPDFDRDGLIYQMDNKGRMHFSTDRGQSFKPTKLNLDGRYIDNLTFSPDYAADRTLFVTTFGEESFGRRIPARLGITFGLKASGCSADRLSPPTTRPTTPCSRPQSMASIGRPMTATRGRTCSGRHSCYPRFPF